MEVLKRKILLENSIDRSANSPTYGLLTATSFNIKISINQTMDDMGLFTDIVYIPNNGINPNPPNYTILSNKLTLSGITFPFMLGKTPYQLTGITGTKAYELRVTGTTASNHYSFGSLNITGTTDSKLQNVRSYNLLNPYQIGFNISTEAYTAYNGTVISGVSRVTALGEPTIYAFDAIANSFIGTANQTTGLLYKDYTAMTKSLIINGVSKVIPLTIVSFVGQGWNQTNVSLSALTKEEYLFGITTPPKVESDVFIDRGATSVMDSHLRLSEIRNLGELVKYGNGFYNLTQQ